MLLIMISLYGFPTILPWTDIHYVTYDDYPVWLSYNLAVDRHKLVAAILYGNCRPAIKPNNELCGEDRQHAAHKKSYSTFDNRFK